MAHYNIVLLTYLLTYLLNLYKYLFCSNMVNKLLSPLSLYSHEYGHTYTLIKLLPNNLCKKSYVHVLL